MIFTSKVVSESENGANFYTVEKNLDVDCDCILICDDCKVCTIQSSYDCFDYAIKGNLYKHIHFVMIEIAKNLLRSSLGVEKEGYQSSSKDSLSQEDHLFFTMISNEKRETKDITQKKEKTCPSWIFFRIFFLNLLH